MVTISDKRFGELVVKAAALELAMEFAENQAEVISKQEEASVAGMAEIKRLREELKATQEKAEMHKRNENFVVGVNKEILIRSMARAREIDALREELAAVRAELEQSKANFRDSVNNTEYWMKSSDAANKNYQAAVEAGEYWKGMYGVAFRRAEEFKAKVAAILE